MTNLDPQHVSELLAQTRPGPWEYECDGDGTHRMWSGTGPERGYFMEDVDGFQMPDPDWELAALAPTLATGWIRIRRELAEWRVDLEMQYAADMLSPDGMCALSDGIDKITEILGETDD